MTVSVLGAGAFGTALAIALAEDGRPVTLWARDMADMDVKRENSKRLPGFPFPPSLSVTTNMEDAIAPIILLVVPMQTLSTFLSDSAQHFAGKTLVACCKGIEISTGRGPAQIIRETCPDALPALLSGPSFAVDIAAGLPTAMTLAAEDPEPLQVALSTDTLRLYRSTDMDGVEVGGALKNVIAIACGLTIGAGLGESARAALMTRGFAEMTRFAQARGAKSGTLEGLSGFGDLALTCTSQKSRNFAFGYALGRGETGAQDLTIEGRHTAKAVSIAAKTAGIEMPIADMVVAIVEGNISINEAVSLLLNRPLKEE
ncbi:MAG: NAD(P)H-dependent glycerol-3-phosphate dehydrogenase [Maritimibacter sp.]